MNLGNQGVTHAERKLINCNIAFGATLQCLTVHAPLQYTRQCVKTVAVQLPQTAPANSFTKFLKFLLTFERRHLSKNIDWFINCFYCSTTFSGMLIVATDLKLKSDKHVSKVKTTNRIVGIVRAARRRVP